MTNDDAGLSQTESAQWDAIVASEWPVESAILATQISSTSFPPGASDAITEQRLITVYQPPRPRLIPLAVGALALAASAWLTIQDLDSRLSGRRTHGHLPVPAGHRGAHAHRRGLAHGACCRCGGSLLRRLGRRHCPIPTSTCILPPRCQPIDSGDPLRPTPQPRDRGNVDPAAPRLVHRGRLVDPAAVGTDRRQPRRHQ